MREAFFNLTGFSRELFNLILGYFAIKLIYHVTLIAIRFIINVWSTIKGGRTSA